LKQNKTKPKKVGIPKKGPPSFEQIFALEPKQKEAKIE
jgi:hypothetical protein